LGSVDLPVQHCLEGAFDESLELTGDGICGGTLRVKVKVWGLLPDTTEVAAPSSITRVSFRTPHEMQEPRLDVFARRGNNPFALVCAFAVQVPENLSTFAEPVFPEIDHGVCTRFNFRCRELLPLGAFVLTECNVLERRFSAPTDVEVMADIDGDSSATMVQRDGESVVVWAACPVGVQDLWISLRRRPTEPYVKAVKYRVTVEQSCPISGLPTFLGMFHSLKACLCEPRQGLLQAGRQRFRMHVDENLAVNLAVCCADGARHALTSEGDGLFEGFIVVEPPEVLLCACPTGGDFETIARFAVQ